MEYKLEYILTKGLVKFVPNPNCEKYELYKIETDVDGVTRNILVSTILSKDDLYAKGIKQSGVSARLFYPTLDNGYEYLFSLKSNVGTVHTYTFSIGYHSPEAYGIIKYISSNNIDVGQVSSLFFPLNLDFRSFLFQTTGQTGESYYSLCRINYNFYQFNIDYGGEYFIKGIPNEYSCLLKKTSCSNISSLKLIKTSSVQYKSYTPFLTTTISSI